MKQYKPLFMIMNNHREFQGIVEIQNSFKENQLKNLIIVM